MKRKFLSVILIILVLAFTGCTAESQAFKEDYGVFLGIERDQIDKLSDYKTVVIDADYFTAEDIAALHKDGHTVYSYLNVGSIENFRSYYEKYRSLALGPYENWDKEEWVDVSKDQWQQFIAGRAQSYLKKGIDGFFIDNCDVYYVFPKEDIYKGLVKILESLKKQGTTVLVNGGNTFVSKYLKQKGTTAPILNGVNQETVYTTIDFDHGTFSQSDQETQDYYASYFNELTKDGREIYLLEYTKDDNLASKIKKICRQKGWKCYVSRSLELN